MDSCQAPGRSCQHLNFCFPGKTEHFYWLRTKELCWEAIAVSFNFFFIFLSSSLTFLSSSYIFAWIFSAAPKRRTNSNVLDTLPGRDISQAIFFKILPTLIYYICGHGIGINIHACQLNLEMAIYELKQGWTQTNLPAVYVSLDAVNIIRLHVTCILYKRP